MKQQTFLPLQTHWKYRLCHGGSLRNSAKGRGARPLSTKDPIHLVFKVNKVAVKMGLRHARSFALMNRVLKRYSAKFFVKVEQFSIQIDHVHLLVRGGRRAQLQSFMRVVAGQFAQQLTDTPNTQNEGPKVWKYRPFSRVIKGYKAYQTVRDYIQLNECEVNGRRYAKNRLRGLSQEQRWELWE